VTIRLTDLSRFAYHAFMSGGTPQRVGGTVFGRPAAFLARQALTLSLIALIVLVYRSSGVAGSTLAGQSAFALAILVPMTTMNRAALRRLRPAPSLEAHAPVLSTEMSIS
jgi:hypothetical protein